MSVLRQQGQEGEHQASSAVPVEAIPVVHSVAANWWVRTFGALSDQQFRLLWLGTLFFMAGVQMHIITRPWLAYQISGSAFSLGVVSIATGVPMLLSSLIGGVVADRFEKRMVMFLSQGVIAVLALINAILVQLDVIQIWHLVLLSMVQGPVFSFNMPARQAYLKDIVGYEGMANAIALNATGMNLVRVLAPAIAGVMLAWSPTVTFYSIAVMYLGSMFMLLQLPRSAASTIEHKSMVSDMQLGIQYIWRKPVLLTLLVMAFVPILFGMPFQQLLPVFQEDVLGVGESALGMMYTFVGIGSLLGTLLVAFLSDYPRKGMVQVISGVAFGLSLAFFSQAGTLPIALAALLLVGLASQGYMTMNMVMVMLHTEGDYYGRVMSIYMMTFSAMTVAMLPLGAMVDVAGAPATLTVSGLILTASIVGIAMLKPTFWRMKTVGEGAS